MVFGFDTETYLITRDNLAPRLVCLSLAGYGEPPDWVPERTHTNGDIWYTVLDRSEALSALPELFRGTLIGHNVVFDFAVLLKAAHEDLPEDTYEDLLNSAFSMVEWGELYDTGIREKLLRNALGDMKFGLVGSKRTKLKYSLAELVSHYFDVDLSESKTDPDSWRLRYSELDGIPVSEWPKSAWNYAALDAFWPLELVSAQIQANPDAAGGYEIHDGSTEVIDEHRQVAASVALHMMAVWGLRADSKAVDRCIESWELIASEGVVIGEREGWVRVKGRDQGKPGSINKAVLQARVSDAYDARCAEPPRTAPTKTFPNGQIKTDTETLEESGDPVLVAYSKTLQAKIYLTKYVDALRWAVEGPLTSSPSVMVETGRTAWSNPPLQQPPRRGDFRGCFRPRDGWLYVSADYNFIELVCLAQVCLWTLGYSRLAEVINAGRDPHLVTALGVLQAADLAKWGAFGYDEIEVLKKQGDPEIASARQSAKAINFGFPGGMGPESFMEYASASYGIDFSLRQAREARDTWLRTYPEVGAYFDWVRGAVSGTYTAQQFVSNRVRGDLKITSAYNTFFQGLAADGAKYAAWVLCRAAYTGKAPEGSPEEIQAACRTFCGGRPVLFLHDEIIAEVPRDGASDRAKAMARIMVWAMERHVPDVKVGAEPALMESWLKGVDPNWGPDGELLITKPKTR